MSKNFKFKKYGDPFKATRFGIEQGNIALGIVIVGQAKNLAPVDTGQLRNSIQYKTQKQGSRSGFPGLKEVVKKPADVIIGASVEHAVYQEFGTKRMKAQPYLRPAIELVVKKMASLLGIEFHREMKKETK